MNNKKGADFLVDAKPKKKKHSDLLHFKKFHIRTSTLVLCIIIILMAVIFVIRPTILGYGVYQNVAENNLEELAQDVGNLGTKLTVAQTNLSASIEFNEKLLDRIDALTKDFANSEAEKASCLEREKEFNRKLIEKEDQVKEELSEMETEMDEKVNERTAELTEQLNQCNQDLINETSGIDALQDQYDDFVKSISRSICCKEKVDNPNINSYDLSNNRIICSEEGEYVLDC